MFVPLICRAVFSVLSSFAIISLGKRELVYFNCLLCVFCLCSVTLPLGAVG